MPRRREQLVPGRPNVIVFENYASSHNEATVRIDVQSEARLNELEAIMRKLSTGELKIIQLSEIEDAHWVAPLANIVLGVSVRGSDDRIHHRR